MGKYTKEYITQITLEQTEHKPEEKVRSSEKQKDIDNNNLESTVQVGTDEISDKNSVKAKNDSQRRRLSRQMGINQKSQQIQK